METHAPHPIYRRLQRHLDTFPIGLPATETGVEIEILQYFFTPQEAHLACCLSLLTSSPRAVSRRLAKRFAVRMNMQEVERLLEGMFMKGSIDRSGSEPPYAYRNAMLAIGMFEFHVDHLETEFMEKMREYLDGAFGEEFFRSTLPQLRTSPHLAAVIPEHIIDTYDNMKEFVQQTDQPIAVVNCVCKQGEAVQGHPCKQVDDIEICLIIGGEGYISRAQGRRITKEECLTILDRAEASGLVLQPGNTREPFCICLCCGCCCGVITTAKKMEHPAQYFASNYYAEIDASACTGCGYCIDRCQMDAIAIDEVSGLAVLDTGRCIGCGLCVTRCPTGAARLIKKDRVTVPPRNVAELYLNILKGKVGRKRMILNMFRMLTGKS